jgi:hypothetical protein
MALLDIPSPLGRFLGRRPWAGWLGKRAPQAVTTLSIGDTCLVVRVEPGRNGGRPCVAQALEGVASDLPRWRASGLFEGSRSVLVLSGAERHVLTLDRPEVPAEELGMAIRWPLGESLEVEAEQLLTSALEMPRINDAAPVQVLAIAAHIEPVRAKLALLRTAGIDVRSIDIQDSALRGMRALLPADNDGWVTLAMIGRDLCIGLLWHGRFCALRTLALPLRQPRDSREFEDQLALHIQRTADLFERQARQLAIRHVLAALPALTPQSRANVASALPLPTRLFALEEVFEVSALLQERCGDHNDLTALACVAAARMLAPARDAPETAAMAPARVPEMTA